MPVVLSGGSVTPAPEAPTVLNTCQTPTEGLPGSPTVATGIVSTPRFATGRTDELVLVVLATEVVLAADLWPEHAVAPTASAASRPTNARRCLTLRPSARGCPPTGSRTHRPDRRSPA